MCKVRVNKETCIACGACIAVAPNIFRFGEDNKSEPIKEELTEEECQQAKEAKEVCPTDSIIIEE